MARKQAVRKPKITRRVEPVRKKNRRLLSVMILVFACIVLSTTMMHLKKKEEQEYEEKLAEKNRLERLIAEEQSQTETISNYKAYVQTTSYIEEIAREVLGLVYKDEVLFRPAKGNED